MRSATVGDRHMAVELITLAAALLREAEEELHAAARESDSLAGCAGGAMVAQPTVDRALALLNAVLAMSQAFRGR